MDKFISSSQINSAVHNPDGHTHHNIKNYQIFRKQVEFKGNLRIIINIPNSPIIYQWNSNVEIGSNNIYN